MVFLVLMMMISKIINQVYLKRNWIKKKKRIRQRLRQMLKINYMLQIRRIKKLQIKVLKRKKRRKQRKSRKKRQS
jgi:hypothetical protein